MERRVHARLQRYIVRAVYVCHWMWFIPLVADMTGCPFVTGQKLNFVILLFAVPGCLLTGALYINERMRRELAQKNPAHTWELVEIIHLQLCRFREDLNMLDEEGRARLLRQAQEMEERVRVASTDAAFKEVFEAARKRTQNRPRNDIVN